MTPTPPPLDLAALRGWIEAGIRMDKEHALEVIARAEAAEAKIAAVRELASPDWCLSVPASVKQAILARIGGGA